ncbi:MAG: hypothetical protein RLZZ591_2911 [Pseudomonadota bacterium]|jgi:predicted alpha/beta-fold hydrolase
MNYVAPWWLPGGHQQTIWSALFARRVQGQALAYRRERWSTPDKDFVDVDWLIEPASGPSRQSIDRPLLVLFHGLEGNSNSHYAQAFGDYARKQGWSYAVPHFRGCSGEINLAPRAYHSGDFEEIDWILARFKRHHQGPLLAVGVSLGGNALMRWAQEMGHSAQETALAVASVCSPLDLAASGHAIGRGFNRQVYTRMFLRSMKPKALGKLAQHPGLFDRTKLLQAKDLYQFDQVFTAPLHGFKNTDHYWKKASAKPQLNRIRVPALVVNTGNDPFVPAGSLPRQEDVGDHVDLWQPKQGGHVGFASGRWPGELQSLPQSVGSWFKQYLSD